MAIFHFNVRVVSRGKGMSAVGTSAYINGGVMTNEYDKIHYNYSHKKEVVHKEVILPKNAPKEFFSRRVLWNSVEENELKANSQLARIIELSLPREFNTQQQIHLLREYCIKNFSNAGMCVDFAIHDKGTGNPHAHILLTARQLDENGKWVEVKEKKTYKLDENGNRIPVIDPITGEQKTGERNRKLWVRETVYRNSWDDKGNVKKWREIWAETANRHLKNYGIEARIDHRSYKEQGIDQIPNIHKGVSVCAMEKKGIVTDKGNHYKSVLEQNAAKVGKVIDYRNSEKAQNSKAYENWAISHNIHAMAETINYMSDRGLKDYGDVVAKQEAAKSKRDSSLKRIREVEARIKLLQAQINDIDTYRKTKPVIEKIGDVLLKDKYRKEHETDFMLFNAARESLKAQFGNGKFPLIKALREEISALYAEKKELYTEYNRAKDELKEITSVRNNMDAVLNRPPEKAKSRSVENEI